MMLRSSSTPILGSLISSSSSSSHSESPNHTHHSEFNSPKHLPRKLSFTHHQTCPLNLIPPSSYSFNSSPSLINGEFASDERHTSRINGFRRVQSDGNLEGLLGSGSSNNTNFDEFNNSIPMKKKFPRKPNCSVLQTIPSFSSYNGRVEHETDDEEDEEEEEEEEEEDEVIDGVEGEKILYMGSEGLSLRTYMNSNFLNTNLVVEEENENIPSKMHLARGLGAITGGFYGGGGSGGKYEPKGFGGDGGGDKADVEEYYKRMVEENPGNSLFLRNYAQFLHKSKGDLGGAEEYYSRAILMDPGDGEILSQYAQLTWEIHHDEDRASSYFERAVQAAPEDSHVLAAYAGFLWETEEAKDDMLSTLQPPLHHANAFVATKT